MWSDETRKKMRNPSATVLHFTVESFLMGWCTNILETSKIWLMHYWLLLQLCSSRCSMHPSWLTSERRRRSTTSTKKLTQPFPWLFKQTGRSWATKLLLLILRNLPKFQQTKNSMKKLLNENYFQWNLFPFSDEVQGVPTSFRQECSKKSCWDTLYFESVHLKMETNSIESSFRLKVFS